MDSIANAAALREALRSGDPVVGGWVSIGHPAVAEITADAGPDFVVLDMEHAPNDLATLDSLARAVDAAGTGAVPLVRVPAGDPVTIKRVLDTGVGGLMVPRVDGPEDAATVVEASRYPPEGIRGTAGARSSAYGADLPRYLDEADDALSRIVQIETPEAVERAGEIAAVDGVDALFVGPADLTAALDVHLDYDADPFRAAVDAVVAAADDEGVPVGIFVTDPDRMDDWLAMGFDFAIVGFDAAYVRQGTERLVGAFEDAVDGRG